MLLEAHQIVSPSLHHRTTLWNSLRTVVRTSHFVALCMRKLQFDQIWVPALLVQACRSHRAESMPAHFFSGESKSTERCIDGVVANRSVRRANGWEDETAISSDTSQITEEGDCSIGKRHDVQRLHFHAEQGYPPFRSIEIEFAPLSQSQFPGSHECQWQ